MRKLVLAIILVRLLTLVTVAPAFARNNSAGGGDPGIRGNPLTGNNCAGAATLSGHALSPSGS